MKYKYPTQIRDVFKLNPELKTVPEYEPLSAAQMCFVMLVSDPESPHVLVMRDREGDKKLRIAASRAVGWATKTGSMTNRGQEAVFGEIEVMEIAIDYYREEACFDIAELKVSVGNAMKYVNTFMNVRMAEEDFIPSDLEMEKFKLCSDFLKNGVAAKGVKQFKEMMGLLKMENSRVAEASIGKGGNENGDEGKPQSLPNPNA